MTHPDRERPRDQPDTNRVKQLKTKFPKNDKDPLDGRPFGREWMKEKKGK